MCEGCAVSASHYVCYSHVWGRTRLVTTPVVPWQVPVNDEKKLINFTTVAFNHGVQWIWVDIFCVDQQDATVKSHEVGKMGDYYRDCSVCFVWLEDKTVARLKAGEAAVDAIAADEWFKRVWTLQESVLPRRLMAAISGQKTWLDNIIESMDVYGDVGSTDTRDIAFVSGLRRSIRITTNEVIMACYNRHSELRNDRVFGVLGLLPYDIRSVAIDYNHEFHVCIMSLYRCAIASGDFSLMVAIKSDGGNVGKLSHPTDYFGGYYGWQFHGQMAKVYDDHAVLKLVELRPEGPGEVVVADYRASVPMPDADYVKYGLGNTVVNAALSVAADTATHAFAVSWRKGWNNLLLMKQLEKGFTYVGCGAFALPADAVVEMQEVVLL
ncbi:hypothetical protein HDU82_008311 [Entophlyctis luteolus]|nr:hypothetical protein HDU82_008311 [Entophlyctis luteolus]